MASPCAIMLRLRCQRSISSSSASFVSASNYSRHRARTLALAPSIRLSGFSCADVGSMRSAAFRRSVDSPLRFFSSSGVPASAQEDTSGKEKKENDDEKKKKESKLEKMKRLWKEHGTVFIGYYSALWIAGYIPCFAGLEYFGVDGVAFLEWLGVGEHVDITAWNPKYINALLAMEVNELFEIVRLPLVITTTPAVSRWIKSKRQQGGAP